VGDERETRRGNGAQQTIENDRPENQGGISLPQNGNTEEDAETRPVFGNSKEEAFGDVLKRIGQAEEKQSKLIDVSPVDALLTIGRRWTKGGHDRVYFDAKMLGLEVSRYNSGNISGANIDGKVISHAAAGRLLNDKCYYDLKKGEIGFAGNGELYERFKDKIDAAVATYEAAKSNVTEKGAAAENVSADDELTWAKIAANKITENVTAEKIDAAIKEEEKKLTEALRRSSRRLNANPMFDPDIYVPALKLGALYIRKGFNTFSKWSMQMVCCDKL